jgi:hypothetical protein
VHRYLSRRMLSAPHSSILVMLTFTDVMDARVCVWEETMFLLAGVDMPLSGPIPEGSAFFCPHCGALYSVTHSRRSKSESNIAKCVVCQQTMDKWDSTNAPIYKLIHRPEDA